MEKAINAAAERFDMEGVRAYTSPIASVEDGSELGSPRPDWPARE
jgi:hypothetical protein